MDQEVALPEMNSQGEIKPRGYGDLMDAYSLHQFIIRKGTIIDTTPEFLSFKRTNITKWGSISHIIQLLERYLGQFNVNNAYIDGRKVCNIADDDLKAPTPLELLDCVINKD